MKKLIAMVFVLFMIAGIFQAQPHPGKKMTPKERAGELKEKLDLSEQQLVKIEKIFVETDKKMKAMFEKKSAEREEMHNAMNEVMESTDKEIMKNLNENQKKEFMKLLEERKSEMKKMGPPPEHRNSQR